MESLEEKCISAVINNFDYVIRVFDSGIDLQVIQKIYGKTLLSKICKIKKMSVRYSHFLLNPYLKDLCLDDSILKEPDLILPRLFYIGKTITSFKIPWPISWTCESLSIAMKLMPNLKKAFLCVGFRGNLSWTLRMKLCNILFAVIGRCCPLLEVLEAKGVFLTMTGLESLCVIESNGLPGKNYKLRDFGETHMANDEAARFALLHFPMLEQMHHPNLINLLHQTWIDCQNMKNCPFLTTFNLIKLKLPGSLWTPMLKAVIVLCPNVTEIVIDSSSNVGCNFLDLCCGFRKLQKLKIFNNNRWPVIKPVIDFSQFFKSIGGNLVEIEMSNIHFSSVFALCKYCSNLRTLKFITVTFGECLEQEESDSNKVTLSSLSTLIFCNMNFLRETNANGFGQLMSSCGPNLRVLHLTLWNKMRYSLPETQIMISLFNSLSLAFDSLEKLEIAGFCHNVDFVEKIIRSASKLQELGVSLMDFSTGELHSIEILCREKKGLKLISSYY